MSKPQTLRALVSERLAAAAVEILPLFEKLTAELEEELRLSQEENQRKQKLLDQALSPGVQLFIVLGPRPDLNQGLNQDFPETSWIKEEPEEQSQEEELPGPEVTAVCVKHEASSPLQHRQTEHRKETEGEDRSSESEGQTDNDDDWEPPFSCSAVQMETESEGEQNNRVQSRDRNTETTAHKEELSGAERKKHQCSVCGKRFEGKQDLQNHTRVHTGEKPYSCATCEKRFSQKSNLSTHMMLHSGEKPFNCGTSKKRFSRKCNLATHMRTHTGEKPFRCAVCEESFCYKYQLHKHTSFHRGQSPEPME